MTSPALCQARGLIAESLWADSVDLETVWILIHICLLILSDKSTPGKYSCRKMSMNLTKYIRRWPSWSALYHGNNGSRCPFLIVSYLLQDRIIKEVTSCKSRLLTLWISPMTSQVFAVEINWSTNARGWCLREESGQVFSFLGLEKPKACL